MAAVIYTNRKSNVQLKAQEEKYALERKQQFQQSKYVVLKPTLLLMPLFGLLDKTTTIEFCFILVKMDLSFFDDSQKGILRRAVYC